MLDSVSQDCGLSFAQALPLPGMPSLFLSMRAGVSGQGSRI